MASGGGPNEVWAAAVRLGRPAWIGLKLLSVALARYSVARLDVGRAPRGLLAAEGPAAAWN